jgi:hypothetical protein
MWLATPDRWNGSDRLADTAGISKDHRAAKHTLVPRVAYQEGTVGNALVSQVVLLTDNIRDCLAEAAKTEDLKEIRSILAEIGHNVDALVVAKEAAAASDPDYEE